MAVVPSDEAEAPPAPPVDQTPEPAPSDGAADDDRRADPAGPSARSRWRWPVLVVVGFTTLIVAALLWPVSGVSADRADRTETSAALPGIEPGGWVEQDLVAREDGLSSVAVRFGTFGRTDLRCTLDTSLTDDDGRPVAVGVLPCADLPDAELVPAIVTEPLPDSAGRTYRLRIAMRAQPEAEGVTYFGGQPDEGQDPARLSAPTTTPYALQVHTAYGGPTRGVAVLGLLADRIDDYGPPWNAPVAIAALVVASIALLAAATIAPRRTGVVLVVAFAVTKGLLWSAVIPPFKGPDEPAHFAYAQFLAVDRAIPEGRTGVPDRSSYSPELFTALEVFRQVPKVPLHPPGDRPDFGPAANDALEQLAAAGAESRHANGDAPAAGQAPAFYVVPAVLQAVDPGTIDARLGTARLWSVALGAVTVWASIMLGRRLFPGHDAAALLLGTAVALQPMISQQTATLTNDALLIAGSAVCTLVAVALADRFRSRWWALAAGLAFGATMLAKPRAVTFAPVLGLAWLLGRWRGARSAPWWWEALAGAAGAAATYGVWWAYVQLADPASPPGVREPGERGVGDFLHALVDDGFAAGRTLWVDHLWGNFGWLHHPLPSWVQTAVLIALLVGAALVVAWLVASVRDARLARRGDGPWRTPEGATLATDTFVCLLVVVVTLAILHVSMFVLFQQRGSFGIIQGRYALPAIPAMLALPVLALRRLVPRWSPVGPMAVVASAMAVLNVIGLVVIANGMYL